MLCVLIPESLDNIKSLVVEFQGGVGDVLLISPILQAIKQKYPHIKIIYVTDKRAIVDLVSRYPFIDKGVFFKKKLNDYYHVIKECFGADIVWFLGGSHRISVVLGLAHTKYRIGIPYGRGKWLTHKLTVEPWMTKAYEAFVWAYQWKLISGMDVVRQNPLWHMYYPEANQKERKTIDSLLQQKNIKHYIVSSLITSESTKDWPMVQWMNLFKALPDKQFILVGGATDTIRADWPSNVHDFRGKTNLLELGYLIQCSDLVINGSSLPIHIASAFDIPSIGLYGSVNVNRDLPRKYYDFIRSKTDCSPCSYPFMRREVCQNPICMEKVSVDKVVSSVRRLYEQNKVPWQYKGVADLADDKELIH